MLTFAGLQAFANLLGNCSILVGGQRYKIVNPLIVERFLYTHTHTHVVIIDRHQKNLFLSDLGLNHLWKNLPALAKN